MARDEKGTNDKIRCSFCGKPQAQVGQMISGPGVYICDSCVELCMDIVEGIQSQQPDIKKKAKASKKLPKPQEIKAILDDYVIGQDDAKMVLSVSVYNHYK